MANAVVAAQSVQNTQSTVSFISLYSITSIFPSNGLFPSTSKKQNMSYFVQGYVSHSMLLCITRYTANYKMDIVFKMSGLL